MGTQVMDTHIHRVHTSMSSGKKSREKILFGELPVFLSDKGGRTTTCIVMTPPGSSPTRSLDSASVLLFSSIFPALISFMSLIVFGPFSLSTKWRDKVMKIRKW